MDYTTVIKRLKEFDIRPSHRPCHLPGYFRKASLLLPLLFKGSELHILLTVRAKHLRLFPGAVAFPGGHFEPGDKDELITALREAKEEIGIDARDVTVVSSLPPMFTPPGIFTYCVAAMVPTKFKPRLNKKEVAAYFTIPLKTFLCSSKRSQVIDKRFDFPIPFYSYVFHARTNDRNNVDITGVTGLLCLAMATAIFGKNPGTEITPGKFLTADKPFQQISIYFDYHRNERWSTNS